jgi:hypothetical protein
LKLSKNDAGVNNRLREYFLSNNDHVFHTGINGNGRSGGGLYISIYETFHTFNNEFYLKWSDKQIQTVYNTLIKSLKLLENFKKKRTNIFSFDDKKILFDMLHFLELNKKAMQMVDRMNEATDKDAVKIGEELSSNKELKNTVSLSL